MNSSKFNSRVIVHAVLIAVTSALFVWTLSRDYLIFTRISLAALWVAQIILLIVYVNKTNRDLLIFLQSFEYNDDTLTFNRKNKLPFKQLYSAFNHIVEDFRQMKMKAEVEHQYFQYSIKHVDTGLISFDETGRVELFNEAAKRLLNTQYLNNIYGLEKVKTNLSGMLRSLKPGDRKLVRILHRNRWASLSVRAAEFKLGDRSVKLISLQDIKAELEAQELDSWQKLIRVLTHEIINSVSPISLLSSTLVKMYEHKGRAKTMEEFEEEQIEQTLSAAYAINKRCQGLSRFVVSYKSLTKLPDPELKEVSVVEFFDRVKTLMKKDEADRCKLIKVDVRPQNLRVFVDEDLIEQVLINILKNAFDALENESNPLVQMVARYSEGGVLIVIKDNGMGMSEEVLGNIFVPFFTTKKKGTGIGLSLSRQIVRKHNGSLEVHSELGVGTTFTIKL